MLFLYPKPPPALYCEKYFIPGPTQTTDTDVTPAGATQVKVPAVVNASWPGGGPKDL
jgi:hypothetical protein